MRAYFFRSSEIERRCRELRTKLERKLEQELFQLAYGRDYITNAAVCEIARKRGKTVPFVYRRLAEIERLVESTSIRSAE